jgi:hypothetical protein
LPVGDAVAVPIVAASNQKHNRDRSKMIDADLE